MSRKIYLVDQTWLRVLDGDRLDLTGSDLTPFGTSGEDKGCAGENPLLPLELEGKIILKILRDWFFAHFFAAPILSSEDCYFWREFLKKLRL